MNRNEELEILIVSDDWFARSLFGNAAEETGVFASIKTAEDAYLALAEIWDSVEAGGAPDVVFLHADLPGMTGLELARRLREDSDTKKVFVAVCGTPGDPPTVSADVDFSTACDPATEDVTTMLREIGLRLAGPGQSRLRG
jgi:CheY-like chemotaxis protein